MVKSAYNSLHAVADRKKISEKPVRDFMSRRVLSIVSGTKIYFAVKMLQTHGISGAPVVDASGSLIGIVSDYDLLLQAATRDVADPLEYNKDVLSVREETPLRDIIIILYKKKFRRLPVVDSTNKVVGIVSRVDVLMELLELP
ncbi:MAG: CBS domain-containing protein [Bdellovibrionales bacterium]|nr:CBS domain-containing protein [Bdellovibrionales bacterium]